MARLFRFLVDWVPTILWMGIIFFMSARPHFTITNQSSSDFFIFKLLHMAGYAGLYILLTRSFYRGNHSFKKSLKHAFIFGVLYAMTDEFHQWFTPTREPRLRDVIIDATGMLVAYVTLIKFSPLYKRFIIR